METKEMIVSGDWYADWDKSPATYSVGYRARVIMPPKDLAIRGAMPVVYASAEVAQDIAERQGIMRRNVPAAPVVEWDGKTLTSIDPDPGFDPEESRLGDCYPGLVRLPEWGWGPVDETECDSVVG